MAEDEREEEIRKHREIHKQMTGGKGSTIFSWVICVIVVILTLFILIINFS